MNSSWLLGGLTFVAWSVFSTWYYTCQVKGLCMENTPEPVAVVQAEPVVEEVEPVTPAEPVMEEIAIFVDDLQFELNSDMLSDQQAFGRFTTDIAEEVAGREVAIMIVGHTCDLGRTSYNQELGMLRANAVAKGLKAAGISESFMTIRSDGETKPIVPNTSDENRQKNRRVEVDIKSTDL